MGFFNYVKAASKFKDNAYVLETIKRLKDFDEFHCLRVFKSSVSRKNQSNYRESTRRVY